MDIKVSLILTLSVVLITKGYLVSGYQDTYGYNYGFYNDVEEEDESEARLGGISLDTNTIYNGVLQPENIIIHVIQNFVNFFVSTVSWFFFMYTYQSPTKRRKRSPEPVEEETEDLKEDDSWNLNIDGDNVAWILRQLANTAEQYKRLNDEL